MEGIGKIETGGVALQSLKNNLFVLYCQTFQGKKLSQCRIDLCSL